MTEYVLFGLAVIVFIGLYGLCYYSDEQSFRREYEEKKNYHQETGKRYKQSPIKNKK